MYGLYWWGTSFMNKMQKGKGGQNFDKEGVNLKFRPASQEYSEVSST